MANEGSEAGDFCNEFVKNQINQKDQKALQTLKKEEKIKRIIKMVIINYIKLKENKKKVINWLKKIAK